MEERHTQDRALVAGTFGACAVVTFIVTLASAATCTAAEVGFLLVWLSAPSAGLACGFALVTGSRRRKIAGALASVVVGLVWGGITLVLAVEVWVESCFVLY